nr:uncharacterized protein LOC127347120 [Lolium perenne]
MSSDDESDDDLLMEVALLIHEYNVAQIPVYRRSLPKRTLALDRKRERGHDMLFYDYFHYSKALFTPQMFRRRFRMSRPLFNWIMDVVKVYDDYFIAKHDAVGKVDLSSYHKCTTDIRMLAYGVAGDYIDEYIRMSESSSLEAMYMFCRVVIDVFGGEFLRQPTAEDTTRLLSINAFKGFSGMLNIIDCMHWK